MKRARVRAPGLSLLPLCLAVAAVGCQRDEAAPADVVGVIQGPGSPAAPGSSVVAPSFTAAWHFVELGRAAGFDYTHGYTRTETTDTTPYASLQMNFASGVACADYDDDGDWDLYIARGDVGPNLLYQNQGDGTFVDVAAQAGLALDKVRSAGALFADLDGDGHPDLVLGGIEDTTARLFHNRGDGTFAEITSGSGLGAERIVISAAAGDYDRDGDLDLALARWGGGPGLEHLFENDGHARFTPVGRSLGIVGFGPVFADRQDFSFTPNFADLDGDGWTDLLLTSDFSTNQYFQNQQGKAFTPVRKDTATGRNMMGAALLDYDGDGRLDWFMTGIFDPHFMLPAPVGNRLFHNTGSGFEDVTLQAGVAIGSWAWGACAADFNNDGFVDLFHVNGEGGEDDPGLDPLHQYTTDASRLYLANGDGTFSDRAAAVGLVDRGQGRGLVCFDADGDGDVDLFVGNHGQPPAYWRNELGRDAHWLAVRLRDRLPNADAIGAVVHVTVAGRDQLRLIRAGSNYASQDPPVAHFGLAGARRVDRVRVVWPDRSETTLTDVPADALLTVTR